VECPNATRSNVRDSPSNDGIGDHVARSNNQIWAFVGFSALGVAGLISFVVGLQLHSQNFSCPGVVPVAANLRSWCVHIHAMYNLGLTLGVIGIVVTFGAVAACAVLRNRFIDEEFVSLR
jgi:hypothetical protein